MLLEAHVTCGELIADLLLVSSQFSTFDVIIAGSQRALCWLNRFGTA